MERVILLYQGDQWLSSSSLELIGVFTDEVHFREFAETLLKRNIISLQGCKYLFGEEGLARQCSFENGSFMVEISKTNPKFEDTDL